MRADPRPFSIIDSAVRLVRATPRRCTSCLPTGAHARWPVDGAADAFSTFLYRTVVQSESHALNYLYESYARWRVLTN